MVFKAVERSSNGYTMSDNCGNRYISFNDLENSIYISFNKLGDEILEEFLEGVELYDRKDENCLKLYLRGRNNTLPISILDELLEGYGNLDEEQLEAHVSSVKAGKRGISINVEGFPIDLCDPSWGFIFGVLPDVRIKKYSLSINSRKLADEVVEHLEEVGINTQVRDGKRRWQINGGSILGRVVCKSGFGSEKRQVKENVSFPEWVYEAEDKDFHRSLIAGILETEGSAPTSSTRSCRITQANSIERINTFDCDIRQEQTPSGAEVKRAFFSNLSDKKKEIVESSPPPLLLSVKRLLLEYDINSSLKPESVTVTEKTTAALWNLCISGEEIKRLYSFCQEYLVSKDEGFIEYIENKEEWHRDKGTRFESYMRDIEYLYEENGYVTSKMLAEYADRAEKTAGNTISILKNKGLVECDGYKNRYKCWKPTDKDY
jgi:hypothetical protein